MNYGLTNNYVWPSFKHVLNGYGWEISELELKGQREERAGDDDDNDDYVKMINHVRRMRWKQ